MIGRGAVLSRVLAYIRGAIICAMLHIIPLLTSFVEYTCYLGLISVPPLFITIIELESAMAGVASCHTIMESAGRQSPLSRTVV